MHNPSERRLDTDARRPVHGLRCGVARIIETREACDKQSCCMETQNSLRLGSGALPEPLPVTYRFSLHPNRRFLLARYPRQSWMLPRLAQHTGLDTAPRKRVPIRFSRLRNRLLKQPNQLCLFGQKGIVAVGTHHFAVVDSDACGADRFCELADRLFGKQPV